MDGRWHPGIGDPTIGGWLTVVAYFVAAVACVVAARRQAGVRWSRTSEARYERKIWYGLSILLAALCVNKQLDLQSLAVQIIRDMAISDGWYDKRAPIQKGAMLVMAIIGAIFAAFGVILASKFRNKQVTYAAIGTIGLVLFVLVRATSFHHVDRMIGMNLGEFKMNWILEIPPILLIALSAFLTVRGRHQL